jgi:hypothetical protein
LILQRPCAEEGDKVFEAGRRNSSPAGITANLLHYVQFFRFFDATATVQFHVPAMADDGAVQCAVEGLVAAIKQRSIFIEPAATFEMLNPWRVPNRRWQRV